MRAALALLREQLERTLLRLVAGLDEAAVGLLARRRLLAAHNLATLVLNEILAGQTALCVLGCTVENLRLRADREHTTIHGLHVHACVHVSNEIEDFFPVPIRIFLFLLKERPASQSSPPFAESRGVDLTRERVPARQSIADCNTIDLA